MGMYTGLKLRADLVGDPRLVKPLEYLMILGSPMAFVDEHEIFKLSRSNGMFTSTSTYLEPEYKPDSWFEITTELIRLHVCFNLKNYDREIEAFLDWVSPHVINFYWGFYKYEEMVQHEYLYYDVRSKRIEIERLKNNYV